MGQIGRAERLARILERDGEQCVWCRRPFSEPLVPPTTEHVVPRIKGGPSWIENEVAACERCNHGRGHRTPCDWIVACEELGWEPRRDLIRAALERLGDAIASRGGQRRARAYADSQLRRLKNDMADRAGPPLSS